MKFNEPIGYALISDACEKREAPRPRMMCTSHSNYRGNVTYGDRNIYGQICQGSDRQIRTWKTRAGADRKCASWNKWVDDVGRASGMGRVVVTEIYMSTSAIRQEIRDAVYNGDTLKAVADFLNETGE